MYWLIILNLYRFLVKTFTNEDVKLLNKVFFDIIKYCDAKKRARKKALFYFFI